MRRVFVSSTCYDLIDLRAEVKALLLELGLEPVMSDAIDSEFKTSSDPSINSIGTCLENVRTSDIVIVILSQRYGPALPESVSAERLSATHMEFKKAVELKKKIHFYVRDRLIADYEFYRNNKDAWKTTEISTRWIQNSRDEKIFDFISERARLVDKTKPEGNDNWYWSFSNSVELKGRIRKDVERDSGQAIMVGLAAKFQLPVVVITHVTSSNSMSGDNGRFARLINVRFQNIGNAPALNCHLSSFIDDDTVIDLSPPKLSLSHFHPANASNSAAFEATASVPIPTDILERFASRGENTSFDLYVDVKYHTLSGLYIADRSHVIVYLVNNGFIGDCSNHEYINKRYMSRVEHIHSDRPVVPQDL